MPPSSLETWEGVADSLLRATGLDQPPQDALALATACGLSPEPHAGSGGRLEADGTLYYPAQARLTRQHGVVAHELGHWVLDWTGEDQCEDGASYIGGALMLPRRAFDRDLSATSWRLPDLRAKHLHCSAELIARRLVHLRDAVCTIFDQGRVKTRFASPWMGQRFARVTPWERELVDQALETGEPVQGDELVWAWPRFDGPHRRVVLVAEAEQLGLRL